MGILFALCSAGFMTAKDVVSKRLASTMSATLSTFFSFLFAIPYHAAAVAILWILALEDFAVLPGFFLFITLRALTDTAAEWFKMKSLQCADLSAVSGFLSLAPVILLVVSPIMTGELPSAAGIGGTATVVLGSVLIVTGTPKVHRRTDMIGIACAVLAAICFAVNTALDKRAVQTASPALSALAMAVLSAAFVLPRLWILRVPIRLHGQAPKLWLRGLYEVFFMISKLTALLTLQAPYVMALQRSSVLFSVVTGRISLGEQQFARRFAGATLIVLGQIAVIFAAWTDFTGPP